MEEGVEDGDVCAFDIQASLEPWYPKGESFLEKDTEFSRKYDLELIYAIPALLFFE